MEDFAKLLKNDRCQVFLFACPANMPVSFAIHPWFVINRYGTVSRWEVFWRPEVDWFLVWGHLHKNYYPPFEGIDVWPLAGGRRWKKVWLIGSAEGELAERIADVLESSPEKYEHGRTYTLAGPNSNSYAQWVLDHVPEWRVTLPWNAFGKNYWGSTSARSAK